MSIFTAADLWLLLFVGCGFFAAVTLAAVLTAKPEPTSPYVVEQLDDEWAVLWAVVEGER